MFLRQWHEIVEVNADRESAVVTVEWVTAYSDPSNMESVIGISMAAATRLPLLAQGFQWQPGLWILRI